MRYPHYTLFHLKKKGFRLFFCALTNGQQKFCFCFCAVLKIYCRRAYHKAEVIGRAVGSPDVFKDQAVVDADEFFVFFPETDEEISPVYFHFLYISRTFNLFFCAHTRHKKSLLKTHRSQQGNTIFSVSFYLKD